MDLGVKYPSLVTDQHKMASVLRPGETAPPEGLRRTFEESARVARIVAEELCPGVRSEDVMLAAEARATDEGIESSVYSNIQGNWVHGARAWANPSWPDRYERHPEEPVRATEFWSIEFSTTTPVPEWDGPRVRIAREEDAWVDQSRVTRFMTAPRKSSG